MPLLQWPFLARLHALPWDWRLPRGARLVDELECVCSVLLAIVLAHLTGAQNISWAAFSGYMVMRGHVADSLLRGLLRVLGTAAGAVMALLIVPAVASSWPMASLAAASVGAVTLYRAMTSVRAYAWLFVGLTFEMILFDKLARPADTLSAFALTRLVEVVSGTAACVVVSTLSTVTLRRRWPGKRAAAPKAVGWHAQTIRHAAQGAVALASLPLVGALFAAPELAQSAISIMAVMLVPISSVGTSGFVPVSLKLLQRTAGCLAGAAFAAAFLLLAGGNAAVLIPATALGVMIGRHIESGGVTFTYVGTQFTLAMLVTLVPDSYLRADMGPALGRLYGILLGMALLEPVLLAWHVIARAGRGGAPLRPEGGTADE